MILGLLDQLKLIRGQTRNPGKALLVPLPHRREQEQVTGFLAHSLPEGGPGFLTGGEGRGVGGARGEELTCRCRRQ